MKCEKCGEKVKKTVKCSQCGLKLCPQCADGEGVCKKTGKCGVCQLPNYALGVENEKD